MKTRRSKPMPAAGAAMLALPLIVLVVIGAAWLPSRGALGAPANAEQATGFLYRAIEAQGREYLYSVFVPREYRTRDDWPVILFLHGRGESGTDGSKQMAVGLGDPLVYAPQDYPFIVVFPQKPDGHTQWEDHEEAVMAMLDVELGRFAVDTDRVYLTGLSQGGAGTWYFGATYPDRFAAIAPVCGYVDRPRRTGSGEVVWRLAAESPRTAEYAAALVDMPVWAFHGELDDVVVASESVTMIEAIRSARGTDEHDPNARLTLYPDANHNSWDPAYRERALFEWLLSHALEQD